MALNSQDSLDRASAAMRAETPAGWFALSDSIVGRVRGLVRPGARVLTTTLDGEAEADPAGSRTFVAERIVVAVVREFVDGPDVVASAVDVLLEDGWCIGVEIDVIGRYGTDLRAVAERSRARIGDALEELLGGDPRRSVDLHVVDVVEDDPRLV